MTTTARCDIVLAATPINWNQPRMDIRPPLNLIYLASYVKAKGMSCQVLDANNAEFDLGRMMREIDELQPRAVGVSFYQSTQDQGLALLREIKSRWPHIRTIGGGPLVTTSYADLLAGGELDVCVLGEGEETLYELLREDCPPLPEVTGIAYVDATGQAVKAPPRPGITDLDSLPFLDYSVVDLDRYWVFQEQTSVPRSIFMTTSRGCAYKCTFCATPKLWPGAVRRYSAKRVVDEIRHQRDVNGIVNISFLDDSFFANKPWLREFFRLVEPLGITYGCIGRADHLTEREVLALKRTGCRYVALGVESGVQDRQKAMKKLLNLDRVKETVRLLGVHGVYNKCFFMLGFPDETLEDMAETINFAVTLKTLGMADCNIFAVNLFAGTELAEKYAVEDMAGHVVQGSSGSEIYAGSNPKLARYSTVPSIEVNPYVSRDRLLDMIVFAYDRVEARAPITAADLVPFTRDGAGGGVSSDDPAHTAKPRRHLAVLKPVLASSCSTTRDPEAGDLGGGC